MQEQLADYLGQYTHRIEEFYNWGFNEATPRDRFGFTFRGSNVFQRTIELKHQLAEANAATPTKRKALAEYCIRGWGRIPRISKIDEIVTRIQPLAGYPRPTAAQFPFENISSWSKWLSVVCPEWALIYDARIAFSLNAINFITGAGYKVLPVPKGRNTTMLLFDSATLALSRLLVGATIADATALRQKYCWSEQNVYVEYLELIAGAHRRMWPNGTPIVWTEMLLFSLADSVVFRDLVQALSSRTQA